MAQQQIIRFVDKDGKESIVSLSDPDPITKDFTEIIENFLANGYEAASARGAAIAFKRFISSYGLSDSKVIDLSVERKYFVNLPDSSVNCGSSDDLGNWKNAVGRGNNWNGVKGSFVPTPLVENPVGFNSGREQWKKVGSTLRTPQITELFEMDVK